MATKQGTLVERDDGTAIATWTDLDTATSDVGTPVNMARFPEKAVQAKGANTETIVIQGSNDGTNFTALGSGLTLTVGTSGFSPVTRIPENPLFLRPATPSGANMEVVIVGAKR